MVKRKLVKAYQMKVAEITGKYLDNSALMDANRKLSDEELQKYITNPVAMGMEMQELEKEGLVMFYTGKTFEEIEELDEDEFERLYKEAKKHFGVDTASSFLSKNTD